jgi:selenoprotein W-related protein
VTGKPVKVKITYCAECGYEPQALELTKALMYEFGAQLSAIELIPWESGTFDVSVDGLLVHSMKREGGFPEQATVNSAVRARIANTPAV